MSKAALEEAVVGLVRAGKVRFTYIHSALVKMSGVMSDRREIDHALQHMRRAGRVQYSSKIGWRVA